ncbi:hypothetical protein KUCAC02_022332, partial [Chaenocephalus aceratus]
VCSDITSKVLAPRGSQQVSQGPSAMGRYHNPNHLNIMCVSGSVPRSPCLVFSVYVGDTEIRLPKAPGGL